MLQKTSIPRRRTTRRPKTPEEAVQIVMDELADSFVSYDDKKTVVVEKRVEKAEFRAEARLQHVVSNGLQSIEEVATQSIGTFRRDVLSDETITALELDGCSVRLRAGYPLYVTIRPPMLGPIGIPGIPPVYSPEIKRKYVVTATVEPTTEDVDIPVETHPPLVTGPTDQVLHYTGTEVIIPPGLVSAEIFVDQGSIRLVAEAAFDDATLATSWLEIHPAEVILETPIFHSSNYVPNTSGWAIFADGTVEFNEGTFRGDVDFTGSFVFFDNDVTVNADLTVSDQFSANDVYANLVDTDQLVVGGSGMTVGSPATFNSTLHGVGNATFDGNVSADEMTVNGNISAGSVVIGVNNVMTSINSLDARVSALEAKFAAGIDGTVSVDEAGAVEHIFTYSDGLVTGWTEV